VLNLLMLRRFYLTPVRRYTDIHRFPPTKCVPLTQAPTLGIQGHRRLSVSSRQYVAPSNRSIRAAPSISSICSSHPHQPNLQLSTMAATETAHYKSKCHCGKIAFEFDHAPLESSKPVQCNCSICTDRGYLLVYVFSSFFCHH
jgi:hypothetical protein